MDPLSAVGLSANILQLFDFVARLVSVSREVRETAHGATLENADLEAVTRSLIWLSGQVADSMDEASDRSHLRLLSGHTYDLNFLGSACNEVSTELLEVLEKVKAGNMPGKWKGLVTAIKAMWAKGQIEALRQRVHQYRSAMHSALLVSLNDKVDNITDGMLKRLSLGSALDNLRVELLREIKNLRSGQHGASQATLSETLSKMTEQERNLNFQSQTLEHLRLESQSDREQRIVDAHQKTFRWIFSNQHREGHEDRRWSDFASWLSSDGDPLYWITGKAGSGKSTLMKYVVHEQCCADNLCVWAGELPVVTTRFYFWNSGDEDQRSQEGLLRSILYDALTQRPDEISKVFPSRWRRWLLFGFDLKPWTQSELIEAFQHLLESAKDNFKLCMFVDGLDEFDGDLSELIKLFRKAISYPNVKACVASRPWIVFEEAFMHRPSLMLEDLTYPDILSYITACFNDSHGFTALQKREAQFASMLIENIASKSCGVFLWVTLVVKSLLGGLANFDRISDLQRRLDEMPNDLEDFYQKIFDSIDSFYAAHAAQLFIRAEAADGHLTALGLSFTDDDDEDLALTKSVSPLTPEEEEYRFEEAKRRLNSRCKGFLEIPSTEYTNPQVPRPMPPEMETLDSDTLHFERRRRSLLTELDRKQFVRSTRISNSQTAQKPLTYDEEQIFACVSTPLPFRRVAYLHRTVRDFIGSPPIRARIIQMAGHFDPYCSLLRSSILMIKTWDNGRKRHNSLSEHVKQAMKYAAKLEESGNLPLELIDEINLSVDEIVAESPMCMEPPDVPPDYAPLQRHWGATCFSDDLAHSSRGFLEFAAQYRLHSYICAKITQDICILSTQGRRPLLDSIVTQRAVFLSFCEPTLMNTSSQPPALALVQHALLKGDDPNYQARGQTTWSRLLGECVKISQFSPSVRELSHWADIVELFIRAGADPRINRNSQQGSCIREAFGQRLEDRSRQLEKLLSTTKKRWSRSKKFVIPPMKEKLPARDEMVSMNVHTRLEKVKISDGSLADHYTSMVTSTSSSSKENDARRVMWPMSSPSRPDRVPDYQS